ncbi:hypothetical protein MGA5115_02605 [Marinomonas gallaica]|uniref:Uncharacterized protein n=1 Tax=Marinomonas gallaica TaxID=1806667 RepID=A0A1C3JTB5_9GAMM|nr:DUF2057 domain-containing protein [Marinomonas gallaica]SBT18474.1 hypothetical protein MGA5115_02605 [Marinomonas gallaica]SBT22817.1 hypothetical protein MGA5116_03447 [Marinomonas gallaica]
MRLKSGVMVLGMLLGAGSMPALAATFEVPQNFEIMYVDLESTSFGNDFETDVEPGERQFVVRFNQRIGGGSNAEFFESEPYIIDVKVKEDSDIVLQAPYFFNKSDAERFAKAPEFSLVDEGRMDKLDYQIRMLPKKSGFQPSRDYKSEIREFTATYKQPVVDKPKAAAKQVAVTEELEMLKFWYNKADVATRKDIRIWMIDPSHKAAQSNNAYDMMVFWFKKASKEDQKAFQVWLLNE